MSGFGVHSEAGTLRKVMVDMAPFVQHAYDLDATEEQMARFRRPPEDRAGAGRADQIRQPRHRSTSPFSPAGGGVERGRCPPSSHEDPRPQVADRSAEEPPEEGGIAPGGASESSKGESDGGDGQNPGPTSEG